MNTGAENPKKASTTKLMRGEREMLKVGGFIYVNSFHENLREGGGGGAGGRGIRKKIRNGRRIPMKREEKKGKVDDMLSPRNRGEEL